VADLIEEQYECSYSWNGYEPEVVLSAATATSVKDDYPFVFNGGYTITNTSNKKYAAEKITFTVGGKQACFIIKLQSGSTSTDIKSISAASLSTQRKSTGWYTLDGRQLQSMPTHKGLYIHNGRKVIIP
jgi:hypothetical protein